MAILGIGVDIIEVERVERGIKKFGKRFLDNIYTEEEIDYCNLKKNPYPSFAARFAAKEAFFKALGRKVGWKDVEVITYQKGRPFLRLKGELEDLSKSHSLHLSISHIKTYTVAMVVLEKR